VCLCACAKRWWRFLNLWKNVSYKRFLHLFLWKREISRSITPFSTMTIFFSKVFFFSFFDVFFLYSFSSLKKHRFFVVVDVFFLSIFQNIVFIFRKTDQSIDLSLAQKSHSKNLVSWPDRHFIDKCLINENPSSLLFYFRFHGGEITAGVVKLITEEKQKLFFFTQKRIKMQRYKDCLFCFLFFFYVM